MKLAAFSISESAANFMINPVRGGVRGWGAALVDLGTKWPLQGPFRTKIWPGAFPVGLIMKLAGGGSAFWAVNFMIVGVGGMRAGRGREREGR